MNSYLALSNFSTLIPGILAAAFIIATTYAYWIWYRRYKNKKEIKQKDFDQIQEMASKADKNQTLQVSAIYQLRNYINGTNGESFKRPTLELFRSLLESWNPAELKGLKAESENKKKDSNSSEDTKDSTSTIPGYIKSVHTIIRKEAGKIGKHHLNNFILYKADLRGADLSSADLSLANLSLADLSFADLREANLNFADLRGANLRGANLTGANLSFADLYGVKLWNADLRGAKLSDADLGDADFRGPQGCQAQ